MTEQDTSWHTSPGLRVDSFGIALELYRLLCVFFASRELAQLRDGAGVCPVSEIVNAFEEDEIMRILLSVAIHLRVLDDRYNETMSHEYGSLDAKSGQLLPNPGAEEQDLSLREACNKIIHTKLLNFDKDMVSGLGEIEVLRPKVFLYDRKDKQGWRATLDVLMFVRAGHELCKAMI